MKYACALIAALAFATSASAQSSPSYVALAVADGPTPNQRVVLAFRGNDQTNLIKVAVNACYRRAASGYLHTCQVWYGDAWVVAAACELSPSNVKFGIGDDPNSPGAAMQKAVETISKAAHVDVSKCRTIAEYSANDMKTARSVATYDEEAPD